MKYGSQPGGFLSLLDSNAADFTFQTFDDDKARKSPRLIKLLHRPLESHLDELLALNRRRAGVFVTVNETDGCARRAEDIIRFRAIWQDDDEGYDGDFPLQPSLVVSTSPGKFQRLWLAAGLSKEEHAGLMRTMIAEYASDKNAADISRVLRLPGFTHNKAEPYLVRIVEASGKRYTRDELLKAFPPVKEDPAPPPVFPPGSSDHVNSEDAYRIKNVLMAIDAEPYDKWLNVGMILHTVYQGDAEGLYLWMDWASTSEKFNQKEHQYKWGTFEMIPRETIKIYADGSCTPNPGRGSWAAVIVYSDGSRQEVSGVSGEDRTTNQRMELMAAIAGLEALEFPCSVDMYSDSRYLITGMTTG